MLDGIAISVSVLSAGVPLVNGGRRGEQYHQAAPAANGVQGGVNTSTLRGVQGGQQGFKRGGGQAGGQKNKLLARLGPPTVISRLGPKKEDLLARLGPKTGGPTILGRLGAKPGTAAVGANKRGGKK
ncbi:hypothetical protein HDU99_001422 [Rhizoclosmatium hyalinum]|nr:hypothetical protein HDU99_001422 [Rhizoclosmatium hyalinum]